MSETAYQQLAASFNQMIAAANHINAQSIASEQTINNLRAEIKHLNRRFIAMLAGLAIVAGFGLWNSTQFQQFKSTVVLKGVARAR